LFEERNERAPERVSLDSLLGEPVVRIRTRRTTPGEVLERDILPGAAPMASLAPPFGAEVIHRLARLAECFPGFVSCVFF